jgi:hypothetical protein
VLDSHSDGVGMPSRESPQVPGTSRGVKTNRCRILHFILFAVSVEGNWICSHKQHLIKQ